MRKVAAGREPVINSQALSHSAAWSSVIVSPGTRMNGSAVWLHSDPPTCVCVGGVSSPQGENKWHESHYFYIIMLLYFVHKTRTIERVFLHVTLFVVKE